MEKKLKEKLKKIKAVAFDADGVLFTGRVFMSSAGEALKERSYIDGHGIYMLKRAGIRIVFVTAEKSLFLEKTAEKLDVDIFTGREGLGKVEAVDTWLKENKINWEECAAMGDDLIDLEMLKKAGFKACPAQAEKEIKNIADYVTDRKGGDGAIRDFCNLILETQKHVKF